MPKESLQASFGLDIDPLQQSLKMATNAVGKFAAGFAGLFSVGKTLEALKGALDLGSELTDLSNKTGMGAGALYDLKVAGHDTGLELEAISGAVSKMQRSLTETKNGSLLRALGLDRESLASAKPEESFRQIGLAIAAMPNSAAQAAASMQLFGKSGAELLKLFNDPVFKNMGVPSDAARVLETNSAIFDKLADSIGRTGPKINEFFVGFNGENAANMERMADAMDKLDLTSSGAAAGNIVATFTEAVASGQFGQMLWLSMKAAVAAFVNAMLSGILSVGRVFYDALSLPVRAEFWAGMGNTLMSFVNSFNATLMKGVTALLDALKSVPWFGGAAGGAADITRGLASGYEQLAAKQVFSAADSASSLFNMLAAGAKSSFQWGQIFDVDGLKAELQPLMDSLYTVKEVNNKGARDRAMEGLGQKSGTYDAAALGQGLGLSAADSLTKIGGGGNATGQSNALIDISRQQLAEQKHTNQILAQAMRSPVTSIMGNLSFAN